MKLIILIVVIVAVIFCLIISERLGFFKFQKTIVGSIFKPTSCNMYPVIPKEYPERTRGAVSISADDCIGCGICAKTCPTCAIDVDKKGGKWTIQRMQCIQCSGCVDACPKKCLTMENLYTIPDVVKVVDTFEIPVKGKKAAPAAKSPDAAKADAPAKTEAASEASDDALTCNRDTCVYCGLCAKNCPADALKVDRKEKIWEVNEDECLKCGVCIDKCPKKSLSFGAPAAEEAKAEDAKAEKADTKKTVAAVDTEKCVYCNACSNECPEEALEVEVDSWKLDEEKCIGCGACADVCPAEAISMKEI